LRSSLRRAGLRPHGATVAATAATVATALVVAGIADPAGPVGAAVAVLAAAALAMEGLHLLRRRTASGPRPAWARVVYPFLAAALLETALAPWGAALPVSYVAAPLLYMAYGAGGAAAFVVSLVLFETATSPLAALPLPLLLPLPVAALLPAVVPWRRKQPRMGDRAAPSPAALVLEPAPAAAREPSETFDPIGPLGSGPQQQAARNIHSSPLPAPLEQAEVGVEESRYRRSIENSFRMLSELVPFRTAVLYMRRDDVRVRGLMGIEHHESRSQAPIDEGQLVNFRSGYLGWVVKTRTPLAVGDVKNHDENLIYYASPDRSVRSLLAVPLLEDEGADGTPGGEPMGVLVMDSPEPDAFGDREIEAARAVAHTLVEGALHLRFARKVEENTRAVTAFYDLTRRLSSTLEVAEITDGVVRALTSIVDADLVGVTLHDGASCVLAASAPPPPAGSDTTIEAASLLHRVEEGGSGRFYVHDLWNRKKHTVVLARELDMALGLKRMRSLLLLPLRRPSGDGSGGGRAMGSIFICSEARDAFAPERIKLAEVICRDASAALANSLNYRRAKVEAATDPLSGLYNKRHFDAELSRALRLGAESRGTRCSLLLIDIDRFKALNDTCGHSAGDTALRLIAEAIEEAVGEVGLPARYGGDEFAVLLRGARAEDGRRAAERVLRSVRSIPWRRHGFERPTTVSIGVATCPDDAATPEELIEKADAALYKAKHLGRNRCVRFDETLHGV